MFSADKLLDLNSLLQGQLQVDFFTMVTSLLFKVNYINLLTQASPLALAQSIYY